MKEVAAGSGRAVVEGGCAPRPAAADDWRSAWQALRGAYATSTIDGYSLAFGMFERWCDRTGHCALPAKALAVAEYVAVLFDGGRAALTVDFQLRAIRQIHRLMRQPDETRAFPVEMAYRRGRRTYGQPPRQVYGMRSELRDRLIASCDGSLEGLRDRMILSVGYDTLARGHELIGLCLQDVEFLPGGGARVLMRRAKSDSFGLQFSAFLSPRATRHLQEWVSAARISEGPLLRLLNNGRLIRREPMQARVIRGIIRRRAAAAEIDPRIQARLGAHSMRVGAAQDLAIAGRTLVEIMRGGRWRTVHAVSRYVQYAPINVWDEMESLHGAEREEKRLWRGAEMRERGVRSDLAE